MTASQMHTLAVPPKLSTPNSNGSVNNQNNNPIIINNTISRSRAKRNLFGAPDPGEIKRICAAENMKKCIEIQEKYNYDIQNERFTHEYDNNYKVTFNKIPLITTSSIVVKPIRIINNNQKITELINGQDEQKSNNNNIILETTTIINDIDNNNDKSIINIDDNVPSSSKKTAIIDNNNSKILNKEKTNNIIKLDDSECDAVNNDDNDVNNKVVGLSNKSLNNDSKLNDNQCEVMCNLINSTTPSTTTQIVGKDKKLIDQQQNQRFTPYCKKQQPLITDLLKVRKASPVVNMNQPQKAKLHLDNNTDQQQQQQEPRTTLDKQ